MKSRKCFHFFPPTKDVLYFFIFFKALAAARFSQRFWRDERERYRYKLVSWHRRRVASCYSVARSSAHRGGSCTCREAFERLLQYLVSATRLSLCWRFLVCFLCCLIFFNFLIFFGKVTLKEKKNSLQSENEIQSWFSDEKRQKHWSTVLRSKRSSHFLFLSLKTRQADTQ